MPTSTPDAEHSAPAGVEPASPAIPSLASLRDPRRRTAVDLLVPAAPEPAAAPRTPAPRPAEWADLWIFGASLARTVLSWQASCLRRVLGR